jgi:hypothetical protein
MKEKAVVEIPTTASDNDLQNFFQTLHSFFFKTFFKPFTRSSSKLFSNPSLVLLQNFFQTLHSFFFKSFFKPFSRSSHKLHSTPLLNFPQNPFQPLSSTSLKTLSKISPKTYNPLTLILSSLLSTLTKSLFEMFAIFISSFASIFSGSA